VGVALSAFSHGERAELGLEDLVGIDAHGREFPGNFQAHQAVQAAPDKHGRTSRSLGRCRGRVPSGYVVSSEASGRGRRRRTVPMRRACWMLGRHFRPGGPERPPLGAIEGRKNFR
jgi:hypothetical protein